MLPNRPVTPTTLAVKDLPWQILWAKDKCTLCGKCVQSCPTGALAIKGKAVEEMTKHTDTVSRLAAARGGNR